MSNGITAENLLLTLPAVLCDDPDMLAIATVIAQEGEDYDGQIDGLLIYPDIDNLPEELLDILAKDFKVDWWDPNLTLEGKRAVFKNHWYVHKRLGTKGAVRAAISAIYENTQVQEWFEYGGRPYHFKLLVDAQYQGVDQQMHQRVIDRINFYKRGSAVLDAVEYTGGTAAVMSYAAIATAGMQITQTATMKNY